MSGADAGLSDVKEGAMAAEYLDRRYAGRGTALPPDLFYALQNSKRA